MPRALPGRSKIAPAKGLRPLLFSWGARALYIGHALGLSPHRNAVAVVALGLDGAFTVAHATGTSRGRSVLIEPNTLHHLRTGPGRMAFVYVDGASRDLQVLRSAFSAPGRTEGLDIRLEAQLLRQVRALADDRALFAPTRAFLEAHLLAKPLASTRDEVAATLRFVHEHASARPSLTELAQRASLSPSRYRHRFVALTGVPFRRYRTWIAMGAAMRQIARGASLSQAALDAGFASPSHFSTAFRAMFGLAPSMLRGGVLTRDEG